MELHKVLSWNVNGLNFPQKRCLQETHIRSRDRRFLFQLKFGKFYSPTAETKQKGAVIYVKA